MRIYTEDEEPLPPEPIIEATQDRTEPLARVKERLSRLAPGEPYWTIVASDSNAKHPTGLRFMTRAKDFVSAVGKGEQICKERGLDLVAVFKGHMKAMRFA